MEHIHLTSENQAAALERAIAVLKDGGIVVYPTETMYGVGVDAKNPKAVKKLLQFKNRPAGKPISVMVPTLSAAESIVELNDTAYGLYKTFLPGPVTVISQSKKMVDPALESELGTLGIRISSHPFALELATSYGSPITATSANASGKARPYSIQRMLSGLSERQVGRIDLIVDAGELPHNEPSTVIDTTQEIQEVVRAGAHFEQLMPPFVSKSEEETKDFAFGLLPGFLHALKEKPVIFALQGEMGAGKTRFAQGVAKALQVKEHVASPTYTIMKEYVGMADGEPVTLIHMDCWRLTEVSPEEFGIEEYLKPRIVMVIEWASPLLSYFHANSQILVGYHIFIESSSETVRTITIGAL
jgi:L-threonylcarbamoyladenylate synthase